MIRKYVTRKGASFSCKPMCAQDLQYSLDAQFNLYVSVLKVEQRLVSARGSDVARRWRASTVHRPEGAPCALWPERWALGGLGMACGPVGTESEKAERCRPQAAHSTHSPLNYIRYYGYIKFKTRFDQSLMIDDTVLKNTGDTPLVSRITALSLDLLAHSL